MNLGFGGNADSAEKMENLRRAGPQGIAQLKGKLEEAFPSKPRLLDAGECALVVEFGNSIDPAIYERVIQLDQALAEGELAGVLEVMPTYRSLMIHYNPQIVSRSELASCVLQLVSKPLVRTEFRRLVFPACYDTSLALDLKELAWSLSLDESKIIELHSSAIYRVYWHGFAPGLPALGGLPEELRVPRRMAPRPLVAQGSLIIAAGQASVASVDMPCGWHVLGQTPERLFALDRSPSTLTQTGDEIVFDRIDIHEFTSLRQRVADGEQVCRVAS